MDILNKNTSPIFTIVPRKKIFYGDILKIKLVNEMSSISQDIFISHFRILENENIIITLASFPTGKINDKFSYQIINDDTNEIVCMGKLIIVSENENIQDYSKKLNNK
jgi:hypothetical protein